MSEPRISPGTRKDVGNINWLLCRALAKGAGVREAKLFPTLGRDRRVFKGWLVFSGSLMPGGKLGRMATELVILRIAAVQDSVYERQHHERLGAKAGLSSAQIEATRVGPGDGVWEPFERVLLLATDELLATDDISDATWGQLSQHFDEARRIEVCLLVGQYRGLATTIRALRIQPDL